MKTLGLKRTVLLLIMVIGGMRVDAQQVDAEVPGDNFSLEGALELFKKSASPEAFEKLLNSPDSKVNNLDLNGDGYIDYIRVIDKNEGNVHAFILQAIISDTESQDVAVIELEKLGNGEAVLQITGDADVYGIETIIEPTDEVRINAGTTTTRRVVNVWAWPSVQYIYSPYYTSVWVSPWHWSYRPVWYRPWRPVAYYVYRPYWRPYHSYYSVCYTHRITYARNLYRPHRTTSVIVYNRHHSTIKQYRSTRHDYDHNGHYKYAKRDARGGNNYRDSRSDRRQYESRNNASTNGRQSDSQRKYTDSNSRSSYDRRNQELTRSSNATRENANIAPTTRRSEPATMNRSSSNDRSRSMNSQQNSTRQRSVDSPQRRTNTESMGSSRSQVNRSSNTSTSGSRQQATRSETNRGSKQQVARPSQVERKAPSGNTSGNSRSKNESRSKRGGN